MTYGSESECATHYTTAPHTDMCVAHIVACQVEYRRPDGWRMVPLDILKPMAMIRVPIIIIIIIITVGLLYALWLNYKTAMHISKTQSKK